MKTMRPVLAAALILMSVPAFAEAQSLAERAAAAAKHRESQTNDPKTAPKHVYSDKDLPASEVSTVAARPASPTESPAPIVSGEGPAKSESYWRERLAPHHARIVENASKVIRMRGRVMDLTIELYDIGPLNARRGGVEAERQRLISEADGLDVQIRMDQGAIADIEEEGRRAGALPGWFR